jgi:GrpB-like predicted nucleotidyltransferase (UPF0157 family)
MSHNSNITKRPYQVVPYNDNWPKLFDGYAKTIKDILDDIVLEIHHFGSTSIPGMFAKPNIDIYILATSLESVRQHKQQMEAAGFTSRGDYSNIGEEYFTLDKSDGERIASIHIFEGSNEVFAPYRNLRDYLTNNPTERDRYVALKKELYEKYADNYPAYDEGKQHLIKDLTTKANAWTEKQV